MRRFTCLVATVFVLTMVLTGFSGSDVPDLKGTWVWHEQASRHFKLPELPSKTHLQARKPLGEFDFTLTIDKQEGFRFSGTKVSAKWKETVSGVIGFDNKTVYMVDDNGFLFCRLVSPDKMELVYLQSTKHLSVASRGIMTRKR